MQSKEIIEGIQSIYEKYSIPLNLQRHMREVAAVAEMICDNCKEKVYKEDIVASCLIHDLGNIIKMQFEKEEDKLLLDKEDHNKFEIYKSLQKELHKKYGNNAERANPIIAKEIGANQKVIELTNHKAIHLEGNRFASEELDEIIVAYADMRVSPHGVVSMKERMNEYYKRYKIAEDQEKIEHSRKFDRLVKKMEKDLFSKLTIKPEDITKESIKKYYEKY